MKLTNETLLNSVKALGLMADADLDTELAFKITDTLIAAQDRLRAFEKQREKIVKDGTQLDDKGEPIHPEGRIDQVMLTPDAAIKLQELMAIEVELAVEQIARSEIKGVKLKPSTLVQLDWLLKK